jgi:hypothetical protein
MQELEGADLSLVEMRDGTPHCKVHGAMNMVQAGGVWRCITSYRWEKCFSPKGVETTPKLVENDCRAGCVVRVEESKI